MSRESPVPLHHLAAAALLLALAGCSGGSPSAAPTTVPSTGQATATKCPTAAAATFDWPAGIPRNFPKPPGGQLVNVRSGDNGLRIVRLTTPLALREGILFVLKELPRAGYGLGRGDAEAREADAPFQSGDVRGVVRLVATGAPCQTTWLVAVVRVGAAANAPFVPFPHPSASPSLPFG
jgi:hypothetical protein